MLALTYCPRQICLVSWALKRFTSLFGMARFAELLQRGEEEVVPLRSKDQQKLNFKKT